MGRTGVATGLTRHTYSSIPFFFYYESGWKVGTNTRRNKVDAEIWKAEVEKYKEACHQLGRTIGCMELRHSFMGLKCYSWYTGNAPDELNIKTFTDFVKYLGTDIYYVERPTKDYVSKYIQDKQQELGRDLKMSDFDNDIHVALKDIMYYFKNFNEMKRKLGLAETGTYRGHIYSKEELVEKLKDFVATNGFIPSPKFLDEHGKEYGLPNRKTYNNKIGSWKKVLHECGFEDEIKKSNYILDNNGNYVLKHGNASFLQKLILEYIDLFGSVPTVKQISRYYGKDLHNSYIKLFGGYNICLESLGLKINSKTEYTDEELDNAFLGFVKEFNRVPTIQDFNKTGRPSFWTYQQRFGSWAKACIHYGYKPNCRKPEYYMSDGERCDSSYEYDISTWLKANGVKYDRDVPYVDFTSNYRGKMNCDYRFILDDNSVWYVEMAGFINTYDFSKLTSREEQMYYFKIKYKEKLFKENFLNYKIIKPKDIKEKTMNELFDFLRIGKTA